MTVDSHEKEQVSEERAEENVDNNPFETATETMALDSNSLEATNTVHNSEMEEYINQENNKSSFQSDSENTCTDLQPDEQFELQESQNTFPHQAELNPETEEKEADDTSMKEPQENSDEKDDQIAAPENDISQSQIYSEANFVSDAHEQSLSPNSQTDHLQSQDENSHSQDENLHSQDENSQSQDENSQNSLGSQQPEEYATNDVTPSTKISILDDWEDTDSQQSERSREPKSENTVHKLIDDDWADEEEDDSKKHSHV